MTHLKALIDFKRKMQSHGKLPSDRVKWRQVREKCCF